MRACLQTTFTKTHQLEEVLNIMPVVSSFQMQTLLDCLSQLHVWMPEFTFDNSSLNICTIHTLFTK